MSVQRKRKHTAVEDPQTSKQTKSTKIQKSMHAYGNVGKPQGVHYSTKKSKCPQRVQTPPAAVSKPTTKTDKKRKRHASPDSDDERVVPTCSDVMRREAGTAVASTPRNKRVKNVAPPSPAETPTRGTLALFDRLKLDNNARAIPCALQIKQAAYDTPPQTPIDEKSNLDIRFPEALEDLQDLYASFLAALSFHYSHNGSTSPVNVAVLLPEITKHFKQRHVDLEDLRRILAVGEEQSRELSLQDYGRGGVYLTRVQCNTRHAASYINAEDLNIKFENSLANAWKSWKATTPKENRHGDVFRDQMPLLEITPHESAEKAAPLMARGQARLADLKASKTVSKRAPQSPILPEQSGPSQPTQNRGTALLDRILAKQNLASKLPAGPTKAHLERTAALHRIEDVARILSLLAGAKERCSFSLPAVVQHLQQSLRNPISAEEAGRCLALIGDEVIPGFVRFVQSGEVRGVVVARGANVGLSELRARVARACACA